MENTWLFYSKIIAYTVKPVLRGHLWDKEKVSLQGRRLPKRGSVHRNFQSHDKKKLAF
jgi:hypothetical protein